MQSSVMLVPPSNAWSALLAKLKAALQAALGAQFAIEHIGSTAIPGIQAKPIIDIIVQYP